MINTSGQIKNEYLVRLNAGTTAAGLYTDTILNDHLDQAHRWAAEYRKWPFTEGRVSTTLALDSANAQDYPEGWKSDSVRILTIADKRYQKVNFNSFLLYLEKNSTGQDRVFSDYGRRLYVNPNGSSGTMVAYGQYTIAGLDRTDTSAVTAFSNADEMGNHAILEEMLSYAKMREKKFNEAQVHHQRAAALLDAVWKNYADEQSGYQDKNSSLFQRFDVLEGASSDELIKRDRWY